MLIFWVFARCKAQFNISILYLYSIELNQRLLLNLWFFNCHQESICILLYSLVLTLNYAGAQQERIFHKTNCWERLWHSWYYSCTGECYFQNQARYFLFFSPSTFELLINFSSTAFWCLLIWWNSKHMLKLINLTNPLVYLTVSVKDIASSNFQPILSPTVIFII